MCLIVVFICSLISLTANAGTKGAAVNVPSPRFPTIQSAVNSFPYEGTINLAAGTYTEQVVITNKTIYIVGAGDPGALPLGSPSTRISSQEFARPTFEVKGNSRLVLSKLQLNTGSTGIQITEVQGAKPRVRLSEVSIVLMYQNGIYGTPNALEIIDSSVSSNGLSGIKLVNPDHVFVENTRFFNNTKSGIQVFGSGSTDQPSIYINETKIEANRHIGLFIQNSVAQIYLSRLDMLSNYSAHLFLKNVMNANLLKSELQYVYAHTGGLADGIRVFNSKLYIDHVNISENWQAGLAVYGCPGEAPSEVSVRNTHTFNNGGANWISGSVGFCSGYKSTNWIQQIAGNTCDGSKPGNCSPVYQVINDLEAP